MKTILSALTAFYIVFFFVDCTKEASETSITNEAGIALPPMIFGKWSLSEERDSTFYSDNITASSWGFENWFYNFKKEGILEIQYENFIDSFTYNFTGGDCMKIGWFGSPVDASTDSIVKLTKKELIFKTWNINTDNSKTKKVFYLSK